MNYLFQLDGVGPNAAVAFSNQQLDGEPLSGPPATVLSLSSLGSVGSTYRRIRKSRDVPDFGLVHPERTQLDSQPPPRRIAMARRSPAIRAIAWMGPSRPSPRRGLSDQNITFDGVPYTNVARIQRRGQHRPAPGRRHRRRVRIPGQRAFVWFFYSAIEHCRGRKCDSGRGRHRGPGQRRHCDPGQRRKRDPGQRRHHHAGQRRKCDAQQRRHRDATRSGGTITLGSGGTVALGSGGSVTLGGAGTITLGQRRYSHARQRRDYRAGQRRHYRAGQRWHRNHRDHSLHRRQLHASR